MRWSRTGTVVAPALMVLVALATSAREAERQPGPPPAISPAEPPPGTAALGLQWFRIAAGDSRSMLAAVARPDGAGPFPTILLLHGTHGFAREYVRLARDLSLRGLLAVAACWFSGGRGAGMKSVTPIPCPDAPALPVAASPDAMHMVETLVRATQTLPGVRADSPALFGHSRGGGAALHYALRSDRVGALVLNSAGYPQELHARVDRIRAPLLMLHGTADSPADGGSAMTSIEMARSFEAAVRRAGKPVEAKYYDGAGHDDLFTSASQYDDTVQRIAAFVLKQAAGSGQ